MIRTMALALCLAGPVWAETQTTCQAGWDRFTDAIFSIPPNATPEMADEARLVRAVEVSLTPNGWCRVSADDPGLDGAGFDTLDWRAEPASVALDPNRLPLAIDLRLTGLEGDTSVDLELSRSDGSRLLLIDRLEARDPEGHGLIATGLIDGALFDSTSMAVMSIGGMTLKSLVVDIDAAPDLIETAPLDGLAKALSILPDAMDDTQLDPPSRAALADLAQAWPEISGKVSVSYVSQRGLGVIQLARALSLFDALDPKPAFAAAFAGATLDVAWLRP